MSRAPIGTIPHASDASLHAHIDGESGDWLRSGDLGFLDANGQLFITGRIKDLIIIRGMQPLSAGHRADRRARRIRRCARTAARLFSVPDERGEETLVVVQEVERTARNRIDPDEIAGIIREAIAEQHEVSARHIVLIRPQTLPKTTSGKVQRSLTRKLWLEGKLDYLTAERGGLMAGRRTRARLELDLRLIPHLDALRDPLLHPPRNHGAIVPEIHEVRALAGQRIVDAIVDEVRARPPGDDLLQRGLARRFLGRRERARTRQRAGIGRRHEQHDRHSRPAVS